MLYSIDRIEHDTVICEDMEGNPLILKQQQVSPAAREGDLLFEEDGMWMVDVQATAERRAVLAQKRKALLRREGK